MKKLLVLSSLLLVSCAQVPENGPKSVSFPYAVGLLKKIQQSPLRAPASVPTQEKEERSTRRVYFSALYHQYLTLADGAEKIGSCPAFHHDKVDTEAFSVPKLSFQKSQDPELFPESVFDGGVSFKSYLEDIRGELLTLCEEGYSDNFYKFDNLVTHYADNADFHKRPDAIVSVLKVPVFANYYLVKMSATSGASRVPAESHLFGLTRTHWFERYVSEAREVRSGLTKVVRR